MDSFDSVFQTLTGAARFDKKKHQRELALFNTKKTLNELNDIILPSLDFFQKQSDSPSPSNGLNSQTEKKRKTEDMETKDENGNNKEYTKKKKKSDNVVELDGWCGKILTDMLIDGISLFNTSDTQQSSEKSLVKEEAKKDKIHVEKVSVTSRCSNE